MTYVALIPMKGHSERVPNKNIRPLAGKPLCHWILETLTAVEAIHRIVINTDSEIIAKTVSEDFDVVIHERPAALCGDFVSVNRLIAHDLEKLPEETRFIQTHSTNPLLRPQTLAAAIERFEGQQGRYDSVFSVTRHQARFYDLEFAAVNHDPSELIRTQDLPPLYEENSNFYLFTSESFAARKLRIGARPLLFEVDPLEAVDIDEESDWKLVELAIQAGLVSGKARTK